LIYKDFYKPFVYLCPQKCPQLIIWMGIRLEVILLHFNISYLKRLTCLMFLHSIWQLKWIIHLVRLINVHPRSKDIFQPVSVTIWRAYREPELSNDQENLIPTVNIELCICSKKCLCSSPLNSSASDLPLTILLSSFETWFRYLVMYKFARTAEQKKQTIASNYY